MELKEDIDSSLRRKRVMYRVRVFLDSGICRIYA